MLGRLKELACPVARQPSLARALHASTGMESQSGSGSQAPANSSAGVTIVLQPFTEALPLVRVAVDHVFFQPPTVRYLGIQLTDDATTLFRTFGERHTYYRLASALQRTTGAGAAMDKRELQATM